MADHEDTILVPVVAAVPRISDAERAELLESLRQAEADFAAGNYRVLEEGTLLREFEAILDHDASDEEPDALSADPAAPAQP